MAKMGLQFGLETNSFDERNTTYSKTCLRRFRWLFKIDDISASGAQSLPPSQSARPSLSFTEFEVKHLTENVFYPGKPDWKPIQLTLFDVIKTNESGGRLHPVFEWIKEIYDPKEDSLWQPSANGFIKDARLEMYDGCGTVVETWVYENVWPQAADFGSLDMANNEVVTCDLTLRYARAYIES